MSRQFNYNLCQVNHASVQECCKLTKIIICSVYIVLNSVVLNSSSVNKEHFNLMLVSTEWDLCLDFKLVMEAESAAETSCFIKIRYDNIPVFVTANNKTRSCIFRLDNFFVKIIFLWHWTGCTVYIVHPVQCHIVFVFQRILLHRPSKQKNDFSCYSKNAKAIVSFVMSVRPRGTTRLPLDGFS